MARYEYPNMYYAYNETFVDDEGFPCFRRNPQQNQQQQQSPQKQQQQKLPQQHQHFQQQKHFQQQQQSNKQQYEPQQRRYEELNFNQSSPDDGETEFFLDDEEDDEEFLYDDQTEPHYYDDKLDYLNLSVRQGVSEGSTRLNRHSESSSSTATSNNQRGKGARHRSSSVPRSRGKCSPRQDVLAPMVAQAAERQQQQTTLRRSHSTIIQSNRDRARAAPTQHQATRDLRKPFHQFQVPVHAPRLQRQTSTPTRLKSYSHLLPPAETQVPPQPRTTAVITPNYRSTRDAHSALPLLAGSPAKMRLVSKSDSWLDLPAVNRRLPSEPLWFAGIILLLTGGITCILCLWILSKTGRRKYYLDFGAISGFVCLILGLVGCRTARWLPHRHYVTGYILLSAFSLLECGILAVLASDSNQLDKNIIDIAGGAICGLSALCILLATLGFVTSACCNLLPPDSRIAHSAPGFSI
ncbi:basic-leucine zipper transcription factor A-like [Nilaparvata lugens]|uniref:basic-leucine zipper transcription factor A-like n=1 Tax=Nilaparvata lugens TaxID=108931 RepID=UPI00193D50C1|nr:basic-leucine zipper transcription factor A-like [Nilaparvata lugens]